MDSMKRWFLLITGICWLLGGSAQTRFIDEIFETVSKDSFSYAMKKGENMALDVYRPAGDTMNQRPVLIWMHGGGFAGGRRDNRGEADLMEYFAKRGYVGISISYRLTRKGKSFSCDASRKEKMETFRAASEDLWDAIFFVFANHQSFGIDTSRMIIGGSSAGAEGVLNAIYMRDWLFEGHSKYHQIPIAGIFSLAGAVIDSRYIRPENAVPAVLFHGTEDQLVPYATAAHHYCKPTDIGYIVLDGSRTIADCLKATKQSYMLYTFEGAGHEIAGVPFPHMKEVMAFFEQLLYSSDYGLQREVWITKN